MSNPAAPRQKRGAMPTPFGFVQRGGDQAFNELSIADTLTIGSQMTVPTALVQNLLSDGDMEIASNGAFLVAAGTDLSISVGGNLQSLVEGNSGATLLATEGPVSFASTGGTASLEGSFGASLRSDAGSINVEAADTLFAFGQNGVAIESNVAVGISAPDIVFNGNVALSNLNVCGVSCPLGTFDVNANLASFDGDVSVAGALRVCDLECAGNLVLNANTMTVPNDVVVGGNVYVPRVAATSGRLDLFGPLGVRTDRLQVTNVFQVSNIVPSSPSTAVNFASGDVLVAGGNLNVGSGGYLSTPTIRSPAANLSLLASNVTTNGALVVGTTVRTSSVDPIGGALAVNANTVINGSLAVLGAFNLNGGIDICNINCNTGTMVLSAPNGNIRLSTPNAVIDSNLVVGQNAVVSGTAFASNLKTLVPGDNMSLSAPSGAVRVDSGDLVVSAGSLTVAGDGSVNANLQIGGNLQVAGDATAVNLNVAGRLDACNLYCNNALYLAVGNGNIVASGNLNLTSGNLLVSGGAIVNAGVSTPSIGINGAMLSFASGNTAVTGNLNVASGSLNVSGPATVTGNVTVNNVVAFSGQNLRLVSNYVVAAANLVVGSRLDVSANANLAANVRVGNDLNVVQDLTVGGALQVNGNFAVGNLIARNVVSDLGNLRLVANTAGANVVLEPGTGGNAVVLSGDLLVSTGGANLAGDLVLSQNVTSTGSNLRLVSPNVRTTGNLFVAGSANVGTSLNVTTLGTFGTGVTTPQVQSVGTGNLSVTSTSANLLLSGANGIQLLAPNVNADFANLAVGGELYVDSISTFTNAGTLVVNADTTSFPNNVVPNLAVATPASDRILFYNSTPGRFVDGGAYGSEFLQASQLTSFGPIFKITTNPVMPSGPGYYGNYANVTSQFTALNLATFTSSTGSVSSYNASTGVLTVGSAAGTFYSGAALAMLDDTLLTGEALQLGLLVSADSGTTWQPVTFSNSVGSTSGGANPVGTSATLPFAFATTVSSQLVLFVARIVDSAGAPTQNLTGVHYGLSFYLKRGA
jgi:hypothetical protein